MWTSTRRSAGRWPTRWRGYSARLSAILCALGGLGLRFRLDRLRLLGRGELLGQIVVQLAHQPAARFAVVEESEGDALAVLAPGITGQRDHVVHIARLGADETLGRRVAQA